MQTLCEQGEGSFSDADDQTSTLFGAKTFGFFEI